MKTSWKLSGLIGTALLVACGCVGDTSTGVAPDGAEGGGTQRVTAGSPARKSLELFTTQPGRIEAFEQTPLYSKLAGYVGKVSVDIGDEVKAGQTLVTLRVPELHDELARNEALTAQAAAEVNQAEAAVKAADATVKAYQARIAAARAGTTRAAGEYDRWKSDSERIDRLASRGAVAEKLADERRSQFRAAEASKQAAEAEVISATAAVNQAEAEAEKARADVKAAQARLRVAEATRATTKTMLAYTEINAPFDGIITGREVDTGHFVQPASGASTPPLLVVARIDTVRVFVDVPEMEAPMVDAGKGADTATIQVQALGGRKFDAKVTRTTWSLDPRNRSLRAEIDIDNPKGALRPGMYATATILLERRPEVLVLPVAAIVQDQDGRTFCCEVGSGRIKRTPVELGLRVRDQVEIVSGIGPGDTVVLARADSLTDGQQVEVIKPE